MSTVWVIKADGTLQCGLGAEIPLDVMAKELEALGPKVLNMEKRTDGRIWQQVCGAPTGQVNAYEISETDWLELQSSIVGPNGFRLDTTDLRSPFEVPSSDQTSGDGGNTLPWPWQVAAPVAEITSASSNPVLVRELIGRPVRAYNQGDALTRDFVARRVNIEIDGSGKIADIWFG